jgi:hypothetical protein
MGRAARILAAVLLVLSVVSLIVFNGIYAAGEALREESQLLQGRP